MTVVELVGCFVVRLSCVAGCDTLALAAAAWMTDIADDDTDDFEETAGDVDWAGPETSDDADEDDDDDDDVEEDAEEVEEDDCLNMWYCMIDSKSPQLTAWAASFARLESNT